MVVDSFKFLPRLIATFYQMTEREPEHPIPWTPLTKSIADCRFGLVTSAGLYRPGHEHAFDVNRELREPTWGDPTYRTIPATAVQEEIAVSHLHLNQADITQDINIVLPLHRFHELAVAGEIGGVAAAHYSFMGFQGYPPDASAWRERYGPEVAAKFKAADVDCVLLTPA